ncbi:MAG: ParB/RepB/Spo0J family partition protein, partial [Planctomycetota bacterium]
LGAPAQLDSLPIDAIELDNATLRLSLDVTRFEGLRRSIAEHGVLVPLLVRRSRKRHRLQVVSGYRRLLAARHLGLAAVPVRVVDLTDDEALAVRLADNIHRDELIDVEIAEHFERVFLGQDDKRDAVRNALGFDDEQIDSILETLQAPGEVRERMIYGVPELATAAQSPEGGRR